MGKHLAAAVACLGLIVTPAIAAQLNVSVSGVLTTQNHDSPIDNTGIDPNLSIGSVFTLTASFDDSLLIPLSGGDFIVGLWGLPSTGNSFFRVDAPGMTWLSTDSLMDGLGFVVPKSISMEAAPGIVIEGDKVVGLIGNLSPAHSSVRPELDFGGLTDQFYVSAPHGIYGNHYNTPGFTGTWDFANSSVVDPPSTDTVVAAVPEPATWAMFLIGFGAIGFAMRQRTVLV